MSWPFDTCGIGGSISDSEQMQSIHNQHLAAQGQLAQSLKMQQIQQNKQYQGGLYTIPKVIFRNNTPMEVSPEDYDYIITKGLEALDKRNQYKTDFEDILK